MFSTIKLVFVYVTLGTVAGVIGIPCSLVIGNVERLYRIVMGILRAGIRAAGIRVEATGQEHIPAGVSCIFLPNHVSNLDPPITIPLIPRRTSVMVKKELFRVPILGRAMRIGSLVPVDRGNRDAGIESVRYAKQVVQQGINMTVYMEGHRSFDGKLLPFKKGPFYLAMECAVPVVPVTIAGTHYLMPKGRFGIKPGVATVIFHPPIEPSDFGSRECLMEKVRLVIESGLPEEYRTGSASA